MGSSQNLLPYITALVLAAFSLTIFPSHGALHGNLITICSTTSNPSLCQKILSNDSRTISANLPELSLISIDLATKQAHQNLIFFFKLRRNSSDFVEKKSFDRCVKNYHEIRANLKQAKEFSHQKMYTDNRPLLASEKLVLGCVQSIRINSLSIEVMNKLMILSCETSVSVNQYAADANGRIQ